MALTIRPSHYGDLAVDPLTPIARGVEAHLEELLACEQDRWSAVDPRIAEIVDLLADHVLAGGKRLRPAFCMWGFLGAGGHPEHPAVLDACAAIELLHAFALLHDDVMDGSATRRGRPALHRRLASEHGLGGWRGESRRFGEGTAVLVGDLAFAYADRLLSNAPPAARAVWDELRIELTMGQYLDVTGAARGDADVAMTRRIAVYKSGRYTVERPLHLGAALAGWLDEVGPSYSAYGAPLGEAFQLRDELLGVFGDPSQTGKPVGDDLREGKPTVLLALARSRATGAAAGVLDQVGRPDLGDGAVAEIADVIAATGAASEVEAMIDDLLGRAMAALDGAPVPDAVRDALASLALSSTRRDR